MKPFVLILMGSGRDRAHAAAIASVLDGFGIDVVQRIGSAHRTPAHVLEILRRADSDPRPKVFITIAGRSNALSGFADPQVTAPVIACPPPSDSYGGADIYSSLRMPAGVAPAVALEPENAAILAAKILALADPRIAERVAVHQRAAAERVLADDAELRETATG